MFLIDFPLWWLIKAPKRIFVTALRFVRIINNELAFTLNLRLIFTPLFGDYSKVGRVIGVFVRIGEIIVGFAVMCVLFVVAFLTPLVWWTCPLVLYEKFNQALVPVILLTFALWFWHRSTLPGKKVTNLGGKNILKTFRPEALKTYKLLLSGEKENYSKILNNVNIQYILKKTELLTPEFTQKISDVQALDTTTIADSAYKLALEQKSRYVEIEQLFYCFLMSIPKIDQILASAGSDINVCKDIVLWVVTNGEDLSRAHFWQEDYVMPPMGGIGKGMTGRVTPLLDSVSEDFTNKAKHQRAKTFVTHKEEIKKVAEIISSSRGNVLIIGEPGSGKTTLVRNMAYEIVNGTSYEVLKFKRIVNLESGSLIAGTKTPGDMAAKIKGVMDEVEKSGDIVLFIDEIHNLVAQESGENIEIANAYSTLEPHLSSGRIQFIGATNVENYRKYIEPNGSFSRLFSIVEVPSATKEETLEVLKDLAKDLEKNHHAIISLPALNKTIELADRLIHDRVFPDKAVDILNRTISSLAKTNKYLTAEDVAKEISEMTHVPVTSISEDESKKLLNIEAEMKKRVIGQDRAIIQVGAALKRARVGIRNENKPIASFLFVGTTGVGKTETAKALARTYFGSEKVMIRLDMSEYQQVDSINRLIGTPDGRSKGILTEAVRTSPFALILLDEIEKAYPSILLAFLQVLDDGRLTDSTGKVIDFTNSIIIATSNVGTRSIQEVSLRGGEFEEMKTAAMKDVHEKFAPEFLNRFNGVIIFRPLSMDSVQKIALLMLESVKKMAGAKGVKLAFKPELVTELVKRGFSPEWGARPLARTIEDTVESYLAVKFLSNEINKGDQIVLGMEVFENS